MRTIQSNDGTRIAYDRTGQGPALILVTGAIAKRSDAAALAGKLGSYFTIYTYDRRGRGDSGNTPPYAVERELEDICALVNEAGGPAFVFGHSSGAVLALKSAASFQEIRKVVVYEAPLAVTGNQPIIPAEFKGQMSSLLSAGRLDDMLELWMINTIRMPAEAVAQMRQQPSWAQMAATAPTLLHELDIVEGNVQGRPLSGELSEQLASIRVPALVMAGGDSPQWMRDTAKAIAQAIPGAEYRVLEGQTHGVADEVLIPVLVEFLG